MEPADAVLRLLVLLAVVGALLLLFEKRLFYFPMSAHDATPAGLGLAHQELSLRAEDGVRLHGWFLPVKDSLGSVVVCHGNAGNISHRLDRAPSSVSREIGRHGGQVWYRALRADARAWP